ncbi:MAG: hypothetical protein LBJ70_01995 [Holosporales bacterium]|nr:hypothetical protein [Holosporales bacterium]
MASLIRGDRSSRQLVRVPSFVAGLRSIPRQDGKARALRGEPYYLAIYWT